MSRKPESGKRHHLESSAAAKSLRVAQKCIQRVQERPRIATSTPVNGARRMDVSSKSFRESVRGDSSVGFAIDNDSGYVSTNPESNLEYPSVSMDGSCESSKPIYLSEDALLEKPQVCQEQEYSHLYYLTNSVVPPSCDSEKTTYSGLEDEDAGVEKDVSNESLVIPVITPVKIQIDTINKTAEVCETTSKIVDNCNIKTPEKCYENPVNAGISPDLFSDEDEPQQKSEESTYTEKYVHPSDKKLIKRVQQGLSGVYPPPSLTVVNMSAMEMLDKINENKHLFAENSAAERKSLLVTEISEEAVTEEWPQVLEQRYHGLHYNRSKLAEEFEELCLKYAQRYVGEETQSTCTVFETRNSPSKRKSTKLRWTAKSPGRRLSHLARRRITFNNPALQNSGNSNMVCSRARQILVDARRLELLSRKKSPRKRSSPRKTPRKTPRKSPRVKGRTPSSSTKKRLALQFRMYSEEEAVPSTSTATLSSLKASITKRALFQSPERDGGPALSTACLSSFSKKTTPKRALFTSPKKNSPCKSASIFDRKRKRHDEEEPSHSSKLVRSASADVQPSSSEYQKPLLQRRPSECSSTSSRGCDLSAHHKKKLQWAVYEALKSRNVGVSHPQFKTFASVLARVTRRFLPNLSANAPRPEGGTSEKMLRIARQHVHAVISGKGVDEIVLEVEMCRNRARRPVGYVGLEDRADVSHARGDKENLSRQKLSVVYEKNKNDENVKPKHLRPENKIDRIRKVIDFGDDADTSGILR